jgi:hypothetical protein
MVGRRLICWARLRPGRHGDHRVVRAVRTVLVGPVSADRGLTPLELELVPAAPVIPGWMSTDPMVVKSLAWTVRAAAEQVREVAAVVRGLLVDTAGVLGWQSDAADATSARALQTGSSLDVAAARIEDAATALATLAGRLEQGSAEIERLLRARAQLIAEARATTILAGAGPTAGSGDVLAQVRGLDARIRAELQSLTVTDQAVADRIAYVVEVLRGLGAGSARQGWLMSLADPQLVGVLSRYGLLAQQAAWMGPVDWDHLADSQLLDLIRSGMNPFGPAGPGPGVEEMLAQVPAGASNADRAAVVAAWFAGLTVLQQVWYTQQAPSVIGNLDGIPFGARDQANRVRLAQAKTDLMAQAQMVPAGLDPILLSPDEARRYQQQRDELAERIRAVQAIEKVLLRPDRHLVSFDLPGDGGHPRAAVAVGDLDTAANIAVFTPGLSTTVANSLGSYDNRMEALQRLVTNKAGTVDQVGAAAVTWIGYDAPAWDELADPDRSVALDRQAHTGGRALNQFYAGITANRMDDPHVTALGHSYGSLTTSIALQEAPAGVDDVILFGSPGLDTNSIKDLHVPAGHAFVMEARNDPVADFATFGPDPNQMDGLTDLSTAATRTADGVNRSESVGHSAYLTENSTSQYNLAVVVAGLPQLAATGGQFGIGDAANYPFTRIDQWLR